MKKVKGFLTSDDVFFETKEEAELHEATMALVVGCAQLHLRSEAVLRVIHTLSDQIERYINANRGATIHPTIDNAPEGDPLPILKFEARRVESMPDVGDSERIEEVRYDSEIDGPGSGGDDASGLRSRAYMATVAYTGAPESREERSEEDSWDGEVEPLYKGEPR